MRIEDGGALNQSPAPSSGHSARLHDAASQFEAMLIGQMLKSVRESADGLSAENDESMNTYSEISEQQFAQAISAQGGLGIAKMVTAQIGNRDANQ